MSVARAYLALGSNLGDRLKQMQESMAFLSSGYEVGVLRTSPVYQNRAVGMGLSGAFLNAVAEVETELSPEKLLEACLSVESKLGRVHTVGWTSRTIDLDLLIYGEQSIETECLQLPHPRMTERDFVIKPLMDLAPDLIVSGKSVHEWVAALPQVDLELFASALNDS